MLTTTLQTDLKSRRRDGLVRCYSSKIEGASKNKTKPIIVSPLVPMSQHGLMLGIDIVSNLVFWSRKMNKIVLLHINNFC